ncbi:hypothetical protein C0Q70_04283 [Pomacea canaliculata]|uniref:Uncharacterized protein n=1 Tax=Pomacea canaliculata TaxID=400727 RepID=A0A2T7PV29_POMCA|nr:hypothetical protein C0Q70_04283 [Pomacea canaliculata]
MPIKTKKAVEASRPKEGEEEKKRDGDDGRGERERGQAACALSRSVAEGRILRLASTCGGSSHSSEKRETSLLMCSSSDLSSFSLFPETMTTQQRQLY